MPILKLEGDNTSKQVLSVTTRKHHLEKRNFKSVKCPESGKEKKLKSGIRTFENSRTTGTGRDVRLSPIWGIADLHCRKVESTKWLKHKLRATIGGQ